MVIEHEGWHNGRIVVEWVGEEILLWWHRLLVWIAQKVLEGERAQLEEVGRDDLKVALGNLMVDMVCIVSCSVWRE